MEWVNKIFRVRDIWILLLSIVIVQVLSYALIDQFMFYPVKGGYSESFPGYINIGTNGVRIAAIVQGPTHGKAAVIYCHGNAEDASCVANRLLPLAESGYTVASIEYPEYGLSEGSVSEEGCYRNAHCLYHWLIHERGFSPSEIFVAGYSIGTGVAVELASSCPVAGLWLEAPYMSAPRIVTRVRLLVIDSFPSWTRIDRIGCPLLILHGTEDSIIPFSQGRALYDLAKVPKTLIPIPGAGHTDFVEKLGEGKYFNLICSFLSNGTGKKDTSD